MKTIVINLLLLSFFISSCKVTDSDYRGIGDLPDSIKEQLRQREVEQCKVSEKMAPINSFINDTRNSFVLTKGFTVKYRYTSGSESRTGDIKFVHSYLNGAIRHTLLYVTDSQGYSQFYEYTQLDNDSHIDTEWKRLCSSDSISTVNAGKTRDGDLSDYGDVHFIEFSYSDEDARDDIETRRVYLELPFFFTAFSRTSKIGTTTAEFDLNDVEIEPLACDRLAELLQNSQGICTFSSGSLPLGKKDSSSCTTLYNDSSAPASSDAFNRAVSDDSSICNP